MHTPKASIAKRFATGAGKGEANDRVECKGSAAAITAAVAYPLLICTGNEPTRDRGHCVRNRVTDNHRIAHHTAPCAPHI